MPTKVPQKFKPGLKTVELPEGLQQAVNDIHEQVSLEIQALEERMNAKLAPLMEYARAQMAAPDFETKKLRIQLQDSGKTGKQGGG